MVESWDCDTTCPLMDNLTEGLGGSTNRLTGQIQDDLPRIHLREIPRKPTENGLPLVYIPAVWIVTNNPLDAR